MPIQYLLQLLLGLRILPFRSLHLFQPPLLDGVQLLLHLKCEISKFLCRAWMGLLKVMKNSNDLPLNTVAISDFNFSLCLAIIADCNRAVFARTAFRPFFISLSLFLAFSSSLSEPSECSKILPRLSARSTISPQLLSSSGAAS